MNDNELREAIENAVAKPIEAVAESGWPIEEFKEAIDAILDLITAERAKWEVEARIDELENKLRVQFITSHWQRLCNETNSWAKYVDRRIAKLSKPIDGGTE
jgi:hypothetical protein